MSLSSGSGRVNLGGGGSLLFLWRVRLGCHQSFSLVPAVPSAFSLGMLRDHCKSASPHTGEHTQSPTLGGRATWKDGKKAGAKLLNLEAPGFSLSWSGPSWNLLTLGQGEFRQWGREDTTGYQSRMGRLWSNIKASLENREQAGDSRLVWSLCLGTFYNLSAQG